MSISNKKISPRFTDISSSLSHSTPLTEINLSFSIFPSPTSNDFMHNALNSPTPLFPGAAKTFLVPAFFVLIEEMKIKVGKKARNLGHQNDKI